MSTDLEVDGIQYENFCILMLLYTFCFSIPIYYSREKEKRQRAKIFSYKRLQIEFHPRSKPIQKIQILYKIQYVSIRMNCCLLYLSSSIQATQATDPHLNGLQIFFEISLVLYLFEIFYDCITMILKVYLTFLSI